jgi:hypothetical protein
MFKHGYALLIGVDENKLANLALPIVKKDVTKLKEVITHPTRCGYPEENVRALTGREATRDNILKGLDWLKETLDADPHENQTGFIYYSGHGHREASGDVFLIPYDARFPLRAGGLAAKDFAAIIDGIRPRRLLVVLDCCHAEGLDVKDAAESGLTSVAVTPDTPGVELLAKGDGRAILSSSRGDQKSWIRNDGQMSVFTYHFVEALTGHSSRPAWPEITATEVMEYVGRTVPATAQSQHHAAQEPVFRYFGTAFPVALVMGGKGIPQGVPAPDPFAELPLEIHSIQKVRVVDRDGRVAGPTIGEMVRGKVVSEQTVDQVKGNLVGPTIGRLG